MLIIIFLFLTNSRTLTKPEKLFCKGIEIIVIGRFDFTYVSNCMMPSMCVFLSVLIVDATTEKGRRLLLR